MEIRRVELLASAVQKQRSTSELYPPWAILDLNQRLLSYQDSALTTELIALLEKHFMVQLDNVNWNSKKIVGKFERSPSDKSSNRRFAAAWYQNWSALGTPSGQSATQLSAAKPPRRGSLFFCQKQF